MTSCTFLVFDDLNSFEEYWWDVLNSIPQLGFAWCNSHGSTVVISVGRRPLEGMCYPYCIISRVHTISIIVDLDITWLRSCCQISPLSSYFPSAFLCYTPRKEVTLCSPCLKGELWSSSLKAVYLYTLFGIILHGIFGLYLLSQFFKIYSVIYLYH